MPYTEDQIKKYLEILHLINVIYRRSNKKIFRNIT